jgi:uncharacterized protein YbgA (DUF1722 family)/uncharacterized protein YbbK (DUF523 family)
MMDIEASIKLGISSCLLGHKVRYDGGHKCDRFLKNTLGQYVEYVPVCPEAEAGLGTPREALRLVGDPEHPRLLTNQSKQDFTDLMVQWSKKRVEELENENLCGFIFKSKSPSCGIKQVKVYNAKGIPVKKGGGIFTRGFMNHFLLIPAEEDGRLHDPQIRENLIERIFATKRWRDALKRKRGIGRLMDFHTRNKMLIFSHSERHCLAMDKLLGTWKGHPIRELYSMYEQFFMEALRLKATIKKHANVLLHMMGYFKRQLSMNEKQELIDLVEQFREGYLPLIVPITLMNHYVRKYDQVYLNMQTYLNPHPIELKLRNHT